MKPFAHSFDYYAMRSLLLWHQADSEIVASFSNATTTATLRKAMHQFRIARSFRGISDIRKAKSVMSAIDSMRSPNPAENVQALAKKFQADFGRLNLSAASKLLWCKHRSPYLIYDSRAVRALRRYPFKLKGGDYSSYEAAWHAAYKIHKREIDQAVISLVRLHPYLKHWHPTKESLRKLVRDKWFKERVFDIALWENGGPSDNSSKRTAVRGAE